MPTILLETYINAPKEKCFDLSRDIDLHQKSMVDSKEKAISGTVTGLINKGETVTWQANHFFIPFRMTVQILEMQSPDYFIDEMIKGPFQKMWHKHSFEESGEGTMMYDEFSFKAPLGPIGRIAEALFLKSYMRSLLIKRNNLLKEIAENF